MIQFDDCYRDKTVLVFGHTGFKGSWLTLWLHALGVKRLVGASVDIPTTPSHFEVAGIDKLVEHHTIDVRHEQAVIELVESVRPDFVFHLAAQALVKRSYAEPLLTMQTNVLGTANVLESLRRITHPCIGVLITSDKCYDNVETYYGYRETDRLGGKDIYSASKSAAEMVIHGYRHTYFSGSHSPVVFGVTRAGNVVGGGDWAADRLIPDIVKAWQAQRPVVIRRPDSTRPWQHVLEPLSGYLSLGAALHTSPSLHGEAFNFGPEAGDVYPVRRVLEHMQGGLPGLVAQVDALDDNSFHEAGLLQLCCDKALHQLQWQPVLDFDETMRFTTHWYRGFADGQAAAGLSRDQLAEYGQLAAQRGQAWVR